MGNGGRSIAVLLGLGLLMLANAADIGKEYRYSYTGNMKYLATEMKSQNTRMAFRSNVRMQKIDDLNFALKIENLEMATVNERTAGCPERVNLTFAGDDRLSEMVEKPFIVAGLGKQFRQFETFALDPIWSVNLKKGLASLVNIFLPESDEPVYENHVSTIYGDCDAHWNRQYQPHWTNPEAKVVNLTRMVDYDKCTKIASWMHGSLPATPCVNCESVNTHPLSFSSSVTYSLVSPTGEHKDLHLETVDGRSTIMHAPNTENGNVVKLITTQRLQLEEVKDIAEKLDIHGDREIYKTLNMDFARETGFKRPIDMKKALGIVKDWELKPSVKTTIAMMKELTALRNDEAGNQVGMFDRKDPSKILGMVIEMMSMFDYEQTEAVFDAVVKDAPADQIIQMQRTFVEVTAAAGHNAGVQFVIDKIQSGEIDTRFISSFLMGIRTGLTDYTEVALNSILNFCRSDMMNKFEQERMKCMLAYTSMVSEVCRIASYAPIYGHPDCHQQKLQNKVFDKLIPDANTAVKETAENLRTYIHMAGNLKTHKAVEFLSAIIHDEAVEHFTHLDAMRGLLMIAPAHTAAVRKVSAEIYFDHTKPSDIRMLASVALFAKTAAPFNLLQGLIDDLKHEPSDQVKMFVVSIIKEIDKKSDHPCFKPIAQHIRYLAPKVAALFPSEWKRKDFLTSYFMLSSGYDATYDYGGHSMFAVLMSDSYLPSVMHIAFGDYMANYFFESFGLTIRQQGMERVIDHMMSPKRFGTAFGHSLWNFGGRRRLARNAADVSTLEQTIEEKLKIAPKRYDPMRFEMQINAFGHDIDILSLNESHFMPLISPKYTPGMLIDNLLKTDRDLHHFHNMRDMTFMVPTEFGLPAWLDIQMPTVISYTRKSSSFDMTKEGAIKMKLDHRLVIDSRLTENFGFGIPLMHVALGMGFSKRVGVNLPLNVDMDANLATGKVSFNKDFRLPHDLINYHFNPYSFKHYLNEPEKSMELALFKDQEVKQFKQEILGDILGVNFHVDGYRLPDEALSQDLTDWLYKFDWRQKLYYWITNPKWHPRKLRLSAQPAETNPSTGRVFTVKHKMTPPEATERPASTFKEFQTDLPESFVHVWHVTDTFKGTKERRAEIEFRYSYTPDRTKHWFQLFYDRTPFSSKEKDHVKVCLISKAKQTTTDWEKVHNDKIQHVNDDQKVEVDTTLHYGKNCKSGAEVVTHVEYSHSDQQKQWLHELETGVTQTQVHGLDNPFMKHFKGCTKGLKKGLMFPYSCHKFIIHSSQLNKMTMDVKFNEHVRLHENPVLTTLYSIMRSAYYPHLRLDFMRPNGTTPGEIHVKSVVRTPCIDQRVADIEFMGPRHTSIWKSVPVSWGAHWAPKTATHLGMTNMQSYSRKWYHRYCDIQHNSVATFDNVMYEIPETTCWKVLAKDCSEHKIFTILSRNTENKKKDVRVLMDMHIFDISHVGDAIMLKMDGVEQKLVDDKPKVVMNERGVLTHILTTINRTLATIETPVYGLSVVAVDSSVFVQVAPFYRGKLCGLCGDFNLDRQHEFLTTDGRRHNTAWSYASNFVVPDDMCTIPPDTGASTPVVTHY